MNELRIEHRIIQILLGAVGATALVVGVMIFFLGFLRTLHLFEAAFTSLTGQSAALEPATLSVTVDNEFRFYATIWFGYGTVLLWVAHRIKMRMHWVPFLFGLFFIGGIGRAISHAFLGAPHPFIVSLMIFELVIPAVAAVLYARIPKNLNGQVQ
jgi:hypothetical protein